MDLKQQLRFLKYRVNSHLLRNPASRRAYARDATQLAATQRAITDDLHRDGIAIRHVDKLEPLAELWPSIRQEAERFASGSRVTERQQALREGTAVGRKPYLVKHFAQRHTLRPDADLVRFGLHPFLLDTVNAYLGLWSRLIYTDLWINLPMSNDHTPIASQRWHRDPEDQRLVKIFLYCVDIDTGAGPFEYVRGSANGPYRELWPNTNPLSASYPPDGAVAARIPADDRLVCEGKAGTLIFCDTHGLHRGGLATDAARVLANWVFVPPGSLFDRRYVGDLGDHACAPAAAFALTG